MIKTVLTLNNKRKVWEAINIPDGAVTLTTEQLNAIAAQIPGYTHPSTHPATIITPDNTHRFVTDTEKSAWNSKQPALGFTPVADDDYRLNNERPPSYHTHDYEPANANIQSHISTPHAPATAQKNSDITKAEIESKLTGEVSSHSHATPTWKSGIATKNIGDASAVQTIAHGLGRVPKFVRIEGSVIISAAILSQCLGVFDGTNNSGLAVMWGEGTSTAATEAIYTSTTIALGFTTTVATNAFTGANRQTGIITVDATNITITWTKTGTVGSLVASLLWSCT